MGGISNPDPCVPLNSLKVLDLNSEERKEQKERTREKCANFLVSSACHLLTKFAKKEKVYNW